MAENHFSSKFLPYFFKVITLRTYSPNSNITQKNIGNMTRLNKPSTSCLGDTGNTGL